MSVERLKRVLWRIQEWNKAKYFTENELRRAIMLECGTHDFTIARNKKTLLELKMIKRTANSVYEIVNDAPA